MKSWLPLLPGRRQAPNPARIEGIDGISASRGARPRTKGESRLARRRSHWQVRGTPVASVLLGSLANALPIITQSPVLPPFGLMIFIAWRLLRPDIWPLWIGLPFGLFDDIMSGQPIGSAVLIWTATLMALEYQSQRIFFRDYWYDWLIGSVAIVGGLLVGWFIVRLTGSGGSVLLLLPQIAYSLCLFPLIVRLCAALDRWRLP